MKTIFTLLSFIIAASLLCMSCNSTKKIAETKILVDSTAIRERDSINQVRKEDSASYTSMLKSIIESQVQFENDCPPCDSSGTPVKPATVNRLEYYPDGTLKAAEGRIKEGTSKVNYWQQQAMSLKSSYDSLQRVRSRDSTNKTVSIQEKIVVKEKRFIPWWVWLMLFGSVVIVWIVRGGISRPRLLT